LGTALRGRVIAKVCVSIDVGLREISLPGLKNEIRKRIELIRGERLDDMSRYCDRD
jgi:hypothetical protein